MALAAGVTLTPHAESVRETSFWACQNIMSTQLMEIRSAACVCLQIQQIQLLLGFHFQLATAGLARARRSFISLMKLVRKVLMLCTCALETLRLQCFSLTTGTASFLHACAGIPQA